ncbi:PREDICTED: sodium/glucose cotransporter 4-like [Priapulus caudatus]|uniref:Sodium/glucose cotransporter 4-like n=1 Tax=Priapulus caudatus TaxID=37621 RepID=A0ABM1EWM5_PRICU|nr:PREDICTED: sodium/glucose cotransporter 4-like [Priapulus caudatus]
MADVGELEWLDIVVIILYFVFVLGVGLMASKFSNRTTLGGYFLASRSMHWSLIGASLFASNIGSGHFIGLAGSGAAGGIAVAAFELNAAFVLMLLGWLFVPVYVAAEVYTMPEYLKKRFGGQRIRVYLSCLAILLSIFTKISADLFAGAIFIEQALGWNLYVSTLILILLAALFSILGGLTAVIWTDTLQTVIMLGGAATLTAIGFVRIGGYQAVIYEYFNAIATTVIMSNESECGFPPDNSMHLMRPADDPQLPWPGVIFGMFVSGVWYWCSDQVIVQRALAAKNISHAKAGCVFAGYLKLLPMFLLVMPGMVARILFPDEVGCADPDICEELCGSRAGCTNIAYPRLVLELMPTGLRGLMMAVMMAALMSSLTSIFNSSATIFTIDIWTRIRKNASEVEKMIVGRVFVIGLVVVSVLWIPVIQANTGSQLFDYIQSVTSYLSPPVCSVYVLAIFWSRTNEKGAFTGLMLGLLLGGTYFIITFVYGVPECGEPDTRPSFITKLHYLYVGLILFGISILTTVVVSLLTERIGEEHLYRLTFWSRHSEEERLPLDDDNDDDDNTPASVTESVGSEPAEPSFTRKLLNFVGGIQSEAEMWRAAKQLRQELAARAELQAEDTQKLPEAANAIAEQPMYMWLCNANAIAMMAGAIFLWGFYA